MFWYALLCLFQFCNRLKEEETELVALLFIIVFWMSCYCKCPVAPSYSAMGWSAVCDCGFFYTIHLLFSSFCFSLLNMMHHFGIFLFWFGVQIMVIQYKIMCDLHSLVLQTYADEKSWVYSQSYLVPWVVLQRVIVQFSGDNH